MPKVSDTYLESRRQQILDAAVSCFAKKGFTETTIQDICGEARISHGAVYRYFKNKEDIIEASFKRDWEDREARYSKAMEEGDANRILERLFDEYSLNRTRPGEKTRMDFRVHMFGEAVKNTRIKKTQRETKENVINKLKTILDQGQGDGSVTQLLASEYIARVLMALVDGLYVQMVVDPKIDVNKYVETAKRIFWGELWLKNKGGNQNDAAK